MARKKKPIDRIEEIPKLEFYWAPIILGICFLLYYLVIVNDSSLTKPLDGNNPINSDQFIAERAHRILKDLVEIGPKPVCSNQINEVLELLIDEVERINRNCSEWTIIEYDIQIASGTMQSDGAYYIYKDIQNFVVRLSGKHSFNKNALLLNTHYDTVSGGPGAGDAGTMVAVMLEVLRVLATSKSILLHPIIFLFNGAEEAGLMGSHAFITQHKWAKSVKAYLNLDSDGNGGKEILYQTALNQPWLMQYYQGFAPHPFAQVTAEELFQFGFIPSASDFQIFRDYGKIPGLDFAHNYNGYVYHTSYDKIDTIPLGTFQNTGDNVLALVRALGNAEELDKYNEPIMEKFVFYDYLGWFMVSYSQSQGVTINLLICLTACIAIVISLRYIGLHSKMTVKSLIEKFWIMFVIQVISILAGAGFSLAFAFFIDLINCSMSWYSDPWIIFGLYFCPLYFGLGFLPALYLNYFKEVSSLSLGCAIQIFLHVQCVILIIAICVMTSFEIRSTYIPMFSVFFYTITVLVNLAANLYSRPFTWIPLHLIGQIPAFMLYSHLAYLFYTNFIPVAGRSGSFTNPEYMICIFTIAIGLLMGGFVVPIFSICRRSKILITSFFVIALICVLIALTPLAFPYKPVTSPQRYTIAHMDRSFNHDKYTRPNSTGFSISPNDRNFPSEIRDMIRTFDTGILESCRSPEGCNPDWKSRTMHWVPVTLKPYWSANPMIRLLYVNPVRDNTKRYFFELSGPWHMHLFIFIKEDANVTNWSIGALPQNEEDIFYVDILNCARPAPITFFLDLKTPDNYPDNDPDNNIEMRAYGYIDNNKKLYSAQFLKFLSNFPSWTYIDTVLISNQNWMF